jgi:hypothetical protein
MKKTESIKKPDAARPAAKKSSKTVIYIQSPYGGEITPEEVKDHRSRSQRDYVYAAVYSGTLQGNDGKIPGRMMIRTRKRMPVTSGKAGPTCRMI